MATAKVTDAAAARAAGMDPDRLDALVDHLDQTYVQSGKLPHMQMLLSRDEVPLLSVSRGQARATGEPLQADALFRIASMTKPITSVAFMRLVEQGKVALDDPVTDVLPEFPDLRVGADGTGRMTRPMRMIDLLRHTSGLTYGFQERTPIDAAYRARKLEAFAGPDLEEFIKILAQIPLQFDPGTAWNYSISTDILGAILQRMDDKPLDQVIADRITKPLGMVDTHFQIPEDKLDRVPDCYVFHPTEKMKLYDPGATTAWGRKPSQLSGGGGMASTLADYHRFCRMLLNGGRLEGARILGRKTLDLMVANHLPGGGDLTQHSKALFSEAENAGAGFGLGFATTIDNAATGVAGSNGDFYWGGMFSTAFFVDPAEDVIMIFMTQLMPSSTYPIRREIKSMLYAAVE